MAGKNVWAKGKGQMQLEAILCFGVFIAILAGMAAAMNEIGFEAEEAAVSFRVKSRAEACCVLADSVYGSGISGSVETKLGCFGEGGKAFASESGKEKETECIAQAIRPVQSFGESFLEVGPDGHYR